MKRAGEQIGRVALFNEGILMADMGWEEVSMTSCNDSGLDEWTRVCVDSDFRDVIPEFIEAWKDEIGLMKAALRDRDYETIRQMGHKMKGTGGACGFEAITVVGASLEKAAKVRESLVIRKNLEMLLSYLGRVEVVYE